MRRLLIILAKYPVAGNVKTRLAASIGDAAATKLYAAFLADLAPRFIDDQSINIAFDICWVFTPDTPAFRDLIETFTPNYSKKKIIYSGNDKPGLRDQQIQHLKWASTEDYQQTVIITSDSPHLPLSIVENAFHALNEYEVVIGPAVDGGYYLLGIRDYTEILNNVTMHTNHVSEDIIANAKANYKSVTCLDTLTDIDTLDDLEKFIEKFSSLKGAFCSNTWNIIESLELKK